MSYVTRRRIAEAAVDLGYHVRPTVVPTAERTIGVLVADRPDARPDASYGEIVAAMNHLGATRQWDLRLGLLPIDDDDEPIGTHRSPVNPDLDGFLVVAPWLPPEAVAAFGGLLYRARRRRHRRP